MGHAGKQGSTYVLKLHEIGAYFRWIASSDRQRADWFFHIAGQDPFFRDIAADLAAFGVSFAFPFRGDCGHYTPYTIATAGTAPEDMADGISRQIETCRSAGKPLCEFRFSRRFGKRMNTHYWLHELMHFWQDMHGLLCTPWLTDTMRPVILDARSHIRALLLCEAMAETEAIRASWRLKQAGFPEAWDGARLSFDWRALAAAYAAELARGRPEPEAARTVFDLWYASGQRDYYEKRGLRACQIQRKRLPEAPLHRMATLPEMLALLPPDRRPDYLFLPDYTDIAADGYAAIRHPRTRRRLERLERTPDTENSRLSASSSSHHMRPSSPAWWWKHAHLFVKKRAG